MEEPPPEVRFIDPGFAIWIFGTSDRAEQQRQFNYWCGWFGFGENDQPEQIDGREWRIRSSLK